MFAPFHSAIDRGEHEKYLLSLYGNTEKNIAKTSLNRLQRQQNWTVHIVKKLGSLTMFLLTVQTLGGSQWRTQSNTGHWSPWGKFILEDAFWTLFFCLGLNMLTLLGALQHMLTQTGAIYHELKTFSDIEEQSGGMNYLKIFFLSTILCLLFIIIYCTIYVFNKMLGVLFSTLVFVFCVSLCGS